MVAKVMQGKKMSIENKWETESKVRKRGKEVGMRLSGEESQESKKGEPGYVVSDIRRGIV